MPASVSIKEHTGSGPTATTITNARFCLADAPNDGSAHPIQAQSGSTVTSFVKTIAPYADTTPATQINNVKFYTSGTNPWTGVTVIASKGSTYTQATGTTTSGTALNSTNFPGVTSPVDAFSFTSTAPLLLAGSLTNPSTGRITSDYLQVQMVVSSTAIQGVLAQSTAYYQFDES